MTRRPHGDARPTGTANRWRPVGRFDSSVDAAVDRIRGRGSLDRIFFTLSESANHSMLWHGINAVDAVVAGPVGRRRALRRSVILGVEQALVNGLVKSLFRRARPVTDVTPPHRLRTPRTTSFPSGHASAGACAATLLSEDLGSAPVWWVAAGAVSISRVYVGVHHASDVIGGLVLGRLLAGAAHVLWPPVGVLSSTADPTIPGINDTTGAPEPVASPRR